MQRGCTGRAASSLRQIHEWYAHPTSTLALRFSQVINYNHLMPTRYALELEGLKGTVSTDTFKEPSQREEAKKVVKKLFEERYLSGKNRYLFTPLRF